jgi:hypothetical protein
MNPEEKIQHIRDLAKARSKTYYEKNKEKILQKRKEERDVLNKTIQEIKDKQKIQFTETIEVDEPVVSLSPTADYTRDEIVDLIKQQGYEYDTQKTYISDTNRIFRITGCKSIIPCLKKTDMIIKEIKNGKYRGAPYAVNTLKQTFQMLVIIIDKFLINNTNFNKNQLKTIKNKINTEFDRYKELSAEENEEQMKNQTVPTFKQYLQEVKDMFGQDSKQYLVALLYSIFTVRDNYKNMKLIKSQKENDGVNNFILSDGKTIKIFINDFKTKAKYEFLTYTYNQKNNDEKELKKLIEKWININGLVYGDYIFGKTSLSKMVGDMNKMLGYEEHKAINFYRHIRVSEEHGKNLSFEKRQKLADQMAHSIFTSKKYKRNIQIMEIED